MTTRPRLVQELAPVLARTSGLMLAAPTVATVLELVTATAVQAVDAAVGAGMTVAAGADGAGDRRTSSATDPLVEQVDRLQYELGEGPCLESAEQRRLVRVDDLARDERWPRWAAAAGPLVGSSLSAPMVAGDACLGAIKVYARRPHAFVERDEGTLWLLAGQAAILLVHAQDHHRAGELGGDLQELLRRRDVLSRACGVVMGRDTVSPDAAFSRLVNLADQQHRTVHEVAERLLAQHGRLG